jgi:hypothetical protein
MLRGEEKFQYDLNVLKEVSQAAHAQIMLTF